MPTATAPDSRVLRELRETIADLQAAGLLPDPDFPYLVVAPGGERVALFATAEMALSQCEALGTGATVISSGVVLWEHDSAKWEAGQTGDAQNALFEAVAVVRERFAHLQQILTDR